MLKGIVSLKPSSNISKRKTSLSQTGIGKKKKPAESSVKVMVGRCECMHLAIFNTNQSSPIVIDKANTPC